MTEFLTNRFFSPVKLLFKKCVTKVLPWSNYVNVGIRDFKIGWFQGLLKRENVCKEMEKERRT